MNSTEDEDPKSLIEAGKEFLYHAAGLAVILAVQFLSVRYLGEGSLLRIWTLLLKLAGALYALALLMTAWDVQKAARKNPRLRPLFGVWNLVAVGALAYVGWMALNWDASTWMLNNYTSSGGVFTPHFRGKILQIYGVIIKAVALLVIGIGVLVSGVDAVEILSSWRSGVEEGG